MIFRLITNERTLYVRSTPTALREAMVAYIRRKRAEGVALADILYCWAPITVTSRLP